MSEGKHGWLTGWGTLIGGVAAVGMLVMAYLTYAHPKSAEQKFSITINNGNDSDTGKSWWGGKKESTMDFEVRRCSVGSKLVSCSLTVTSPRYDRRITISPWQTNLLDSDGDTFQMTSQTVNLSLERNEKLPFKLEFAVNKDVSHPLTVKMAGTIDGMIALNKGFEIP